MLRARRALIEISENMVRVFYRGRRFPEAVSWSGVFSYEGAVGLLGKEDVLQTSTARTGPFKFFAFPTLTSSSVRRVVRDVSYIIGDDIAISPPLRLRVTDLICWIYYPSSQGESPVMHVCRLRPHAQL